MTIRDFILEQPAAIERVFASFSLDALPPLDAPRAVWLIGSGTSKNALFAVAPAFERLLGVPVRVEGPMAFLKTAPHGDGAVAVVLSQTGTSTTSIAAVEKAQEWGFPTFALTAEAGSRFAQSAKTPLAMPIGPEPVGPKTKGYTASIACLLLLARRIAGEQLLAPPDRQAMAAWVTAAEGAVISLASAHLDQVMVLAQGQHIATALEGSLKVAEMSGIPACAFDTEEALHGRFHALARRGIALFVAADESEAEVAAIACRGLEGLGILARILDLSGRAPSEHCLDLPPPNCGELDVALAIVPFQWLAVALAEARGMRPETMRYPDMSQRLHIKTAGGPP